MEEDTVALYYNSYCMGTVMTYLLIFAVLYSFGGFYVMGIHTVHRLIIQAERAREGIPDDDDFYDSVWLEYMMIFIIWPGYLRG